MDIRVLVFNSGTFSRKELSGMTEKQLYDLWEADDKEQVQCYYLDEFSCAFNDEEVSDQDWLYFVDFDAVKEQPKKKAFVVFGDTATSRASNGEWKELADLWKEEPQSIGVREFDTEEERYAYFLGLNEALGWDDFYGLEDSEVERLAEHIDLDKVETPCEI